MSRADVPASAATDLALDPRFDPVAEVLGSFSNSGSTEHCSGTLVSPHIAVSAAHCLDNPNTEGLKLNFETAEGTFTAQALDWYAHPDWNGDLLAGNDIGIILLSAPVLDIAPATLFTEDMGTELGQQVFTVGFGRGGTGLTGATGSFGTKRAGENRLDAFGGGPIRFRDFDERIALIDFDAQPGVTGQTGPLGSNAALGLEAMIAPGDSGGPLFIDNFFTDDVFFAGVASFITSIDGENDSDFGDVGGFTRVSQFIDWIEGFTSLSGADFADLNRDGFVGAGDLDILLGHWNQSVTPGDLLAGDLNVDGFIGAGDLDILLSVWNGTMDALLELTASAPTAASVVAPEPGTLAPIGLGALALWRRRAPRSTDRSQRSPY